MDLTFGKEELAFQHEVRDWLKENLTPEIVGESKVSRNAYVPKERLMQAVWPKAVVEENNLSHAISVVRRVLGDERTEPRFVVTVPGRGYRFIAPLVEINESAASSVPAAPTHALTPAALASAASATSIEVNTPGVPL